MHLIADLQADAASGRLPPDARVLEAAVLRVAATDVDTWLQSWHAQQQAQGSQQEERTVLLHLGVSRSAVAIRLEECAYNNATFRCPDERGWQPQAVKLVPGEDLDAPRSTTLPLGTLEQQLLHAGFPVCRSRDPGRFVCNYIYYHSLCATQLMAHDAGGSEPVPELHSLFVHVPPFGKVGRATQRACLCALVSAICSFDGTAAVAGSVAEPGNSAP